MEAYRTSNPKNYLEVKRSKVNVTNSINAVTESASYLPRGKAYEVQTRYTYGAWRPVSPTSAMTFKVKGQGRDVTWCVWQVLAQNSGTKSPINTKISRKVAHSTGNTSMQFQGQKVKGKGRQAN